MFSYKERTKVKQLMGNYHFDVLVIGGGITGAGIALDAASRGLSVALVEMQDFSAGTSSRSTKLVHGGLRYLKNLEVDVVAEVGREREIVYENGVHITTPEHMLLPLYKKGTYGPLATSVALKVYDRLARVKKEERRTMLSKEQTLQLEPLLKEKDMRGGGYYVEYRTDDARLTIEVMKKAVAYQALCLNYAKATAFLYDKKNRVVGSSVQDVLTGETFDINATQVINAAGPWVDDVRKRDEVSNNKQLRLTKGVHIVIDQSVFPLRQAIYFDTADGRMVFAIPRDGKAYVGTTDTFYDKDPTHPIATKEDVDYLLNTIHFMFPEVQVTNADVESTWAGVRPLIYEKGKDPSEISRKDEIWVAKSGLMTIAGGKLTGYRQMAEDIVDKVVGIHKFKHAQKCATKHLSLSGANGINSKNFQGYIGNKAKEGEGLGISYERAKRLVSTYGTNVDEVFGYLRQVSEGDLPRCLHARLLYAIHHEMVYTPSDFFIRRTGLLYFDIAQVERYKDAVIAIMASEIGYTEEQRRQFTEELIIALHEAKYPQ